ncbi:translocation/assembly module TamB domain-containing protein [Xanthocytophaga agilis]|uniref:Translocation/assembly module TamB domain-containing protein n=1 Tax=Xanthocytophaga agilis TaxID=3048010 RepID=A0AAE3R2F4_9BACT|nr:translocation/assembly module TamB domain-containing protein [Xanthocytophaga agilis]MDJ1500389.1 translocation/assembly module TamB domain-containing protein [Xanthocytophaga agilis]
MWQFVKKFIARIVYSIPIWLLVVLGILAALQTTTVQTYLAGHATKYLSDKVGFPIYVDYLNIRWPDYVVLRNVNILDRENQRMIEAGEVQVDFKWSTLIDGKNIYIDKVILKNAHVRLIKSKKTNELNIDEFVATVDSILNPPRKTKRVGPAPIFQIDQAWLNNVQFSYNDQREDTIREGFDYYHFTIDSIQAVAHQLRFVADTVQTTVENLQGQDNHTNLDIHRLSTNFLYTKHIIELAQLRLDIGNSTIRERIAFKYDRPADLSDFVEKTFMNADLNETRIYSKDLALFAPYLNRYEEYWSVSGHFNGLVGRFRLRNANLQFGEKSRINGNISFEGLPNFKETLIDFDLKPSVIVITDLQQYLDSSSFRTSRKFGTIRLSGKFLGFPEDFVANGTFDTDLGTIISDINLKNKTNTAYKGHLTTRNFDLGAFLGEPKVVQHLDMDGEIEGEGLKMKDANLQLKANISRLGYKSYDYNAITVDGKLSKQQFNGSLSIKDTNLIFDAKGEIDLRNNHNLVNIEADLQKADLKALNLTSKDATIRTQLHINSRGLKLDDIVGDAIFTNGYVLYNNKDLVIDSLQIHSVKDSGQRIFNIRSSFANIDAEGNFDFTRLSTDFQNLIKEYQLNFSNNAKEIKRYYSSKEKNKGPRYSLDYNVFLRDINPVLLMFYPDWSISRNTTIEGSFSQGRSARVSLHSTIDTLSYKNNIFYTNEVDVNSSKLSDSTTVLAVTYLQSKKQKIGATQTENMALEAVWNGKHIEFSSKIQQSSNSNYADLRGDVEFQSDQISLKFKPSHFQIFKNVWHIDTTNLITIQNRNINFNDLQFTNQYQFISLDGTLSEDSTKALRLSLKEFGLQALNPLVDHELGGAVNGFIEIKDFYKNRSIESELTIEELVVDKFLVGDIIGESHWNEETQNINANYQVYRMDQRIVRLYGIYNPQAAENAMDMQIILDRANLEILEPFFKEQVSRLGGTASGTLSLTGTITTPILSGEVNVYNGRFRYNYLNTFYYFDDKVHFSRNEIGVKNLQLRDEDENIALINGGVFHDGFKNFVLSLTGRMRNFKVLNTTLKDNDLFYGTAYVTGDLSLLGAIENLTIRANARSNKGTKIAIPISDTRTISQQDFISFATKTKPSATLTEKDKREQVDLTGVLMDFNFDITPDAWCEIIFDEKAGDIIRGNGSGRIRMEIDTKGDFRMFGNYTINKGAYNFTLLNAVNKAFTIEPGGTVSWSGDPYGGILDINAIYTQSASILPIITSDVNKLSAQEQMEARKHYPVTVQMRLTGNLLSPKIGLGIDFKNFPQNSQFYVNVMDFKNRISVNEQELNKQVFSLLILQRLSAENFSGLGQGTVTSSISELLTNQLSYWASQVNENLEVDLNLNGLDSDAWNALQLRLSYALLDGRLRITRDGGFTTVQSTTDPTARAVSVIGDWTIEYILNKSGSLRVKMFNRNSQNILGTTSTTTTGVVAGFSLLHTESFNSLWELFHSKRKERSEPEKPAESETPNKVPPSTSQLNSNRQQK